MLPGCGIASVTLLMILACFSKFLVTLEFSFSIQAAVIVTLS